MSVLDVLRGLVRTSKPFLRDVTECNAYALLLFGGTLDVQAASGTIVVDEYIKLAAAARNGSLVGGLCRRVDALLTKKGVDPAYAISAAQARDETDHKTNNNRWSRCMSIVNDITDHLALSVCTLILLLCASVREIEVACSIYIKNSLFK